MLVGKGVGFVGVGVVRGVVTSGDRRSLRMRVVKGRDARSSIVKIRRRISHSSPLISPPRAMRNITTMVVSTRCEPRRVIRYLITTSSIFIIFSFISRVLVYIIVTARRF